MGTHDLLQISLAGREAVLQRGAGKTPHALGQNYKEPAVFSKVRMWAKGPSAEAWGDEAGAIFLFFRERELEQGVEEMEDRKGRRRERIS